MCDCISLLFSPRLWATDKRGSGSGGGGALASRQLGNPLFHSHWACCPMRVHCLLCPKVRFSGKNTAVPQVLFLGLCTQVKSTSSEQDDWGWLTLVRLWTMLFSSPVKASASPSWSVYSESPHKVAKLLMLLHSWKAIKTDGEKQLRNYTIVQPLFPLSGRRWGTWRTDLNLAKVASHLSRLLLQPIIYY